MASRHSPRFERLCDEARSHVHEISVEEAARLGNEDDTILIDVREESEWSEAHAAGAIHLGKGILERDVEGHVPDPTTRLLLYCGGGYRSALAAENLQRMGYTKVHSVAGGWRAWTAAGLPVERGPA